MAVEERAEFSIGELIATGAIVAHKDGNYGSSYPRVEEFGTAGVPFLTAKSLRDGYVDIAGAPRLADARADELTFGFVEPGDVLLSHNATVGRVAVVPPYKGRLLVGTSLTYFRLNQNKLLPRYLAVYMAGTAFQQQLSAVMSHSTRNQVPVTAQRSLHVVVPPLAEQRAIAHFLGTLDDKIELNRRMSETLEAMARALFKSWFVDFDPVRAKSEGRDAGLPAHVARLFPSSFAASELGDIPTGWRVTSLAQLFSADVDCVLTGPFGTNLHAHDYREDGVPLILVKHVMDGRILEDDLPLVGKHKLRDLERYRLRLGDIVFTRVGAVGRSALVHATNVGWLISGQTLRVRVPDWHLLHPRYLAQVFLERTFIDMVEGHALGTTRPSLNTGLLRSFKFVVPPGELGRHFAEASAELDARIQANRSECRTLSALRDTLLPKLVSGQLRIQGADFVAALVR